MSYLARLRGARGMRKRVRRRLRGSPAEVDVREMRRKRFENLPGYSVPRRNRRLTAWTPKRTKRS